MILRRISAALKRQDWATVCIEFVLVVAGILIALQVTTLNEKRIAANNERQFLERLHLEIQNASDDLVIFSVGRIERRTILGRIADIFFEEGEFRPLTEEECYAIWGSHIHTYPPLELPTTTGIISSGQINIISDQDLKSAISRLGQVRANADAYFDIFNATRLVLARAHPDLIELQFRALPEAEATYQGDHQQRPICDHDAMRANRAFLNDFSDNAVRYKAYIATIILPQIEQFEALHVELDRVLGLSHQEGAP